ncbi:hypothetical protein E5K00_05010 [Hymenobacter aquaticus]|uniref:Uncharacterized protein n=1 Tax=Hymenobacter aquaticus TaxID=1867101 RepID=A0A4Z0Q4C8_9BACT|nr:hypothetical protein [Hymenobacter aquaticus]TGE24575.1 hypothetical protein E5K00_05010 [Hymenobacter aquaticus]
MNPEPNEPLLPAENPPESLVESVLGALNQLDPATALYELERLDEDNDLPANAPPAPFETKPGIS